VAVMVLEVHPPMVVEVEVEQLLQEQMDQDQLAVQVVQVQQQIL
jgi:hypothetical protein